MKAIILAAGKGTRLKPITDTTPKPLIKIVGKTILEYNIENIYKEVEEIIIVVKYLKEKIIKTFGNTYKGTPITYHEQGETNGTAGALKGLNITGDIIILVGDQIFFKEDINKILNLKGYGCLVTKVESPEKYGIFKEDEKGNATALVEKPQKFIGNLANISFYKLNDKIFNYLEKIQKSQRGEYEITDIISLFMKDYDFKLIKGDFIDIGYPWNILSANKYFLDKLNKISVNGEIEEGVTIKGNLILEEGAIIKAGTYIEGNCYIGENTIVGPNTYLRGSTVIGNNCKIGNAVEIKNSSIGDNTSSAHLSYIGDSIIGNNVNLAGGFMSANLRHDQNNIKVMLKGELVDSGLRKLGAIVGDNVKTGMNTSVYPGRIIDTGSTTIPGEIIK